MSLNGIPTEIGKCKYLIKKGESPAKDRSNIFPWTPHLAKRADEFEPFKGHLPGNEPRRARRPDKAKVDIDPDEKKILLIVDKMKTFTSDQNTADGLPRIEELEKALNFVVTSDMRLKALELAEASKPAATPEAPLPEDDEEEEEIDGDSSEAGGDENEEGDQEE